MTVRVRQVVFARPSCDLLRLPIRSSVAILPAAISLVQEPLVVALQLVVQDHAIHSAALLSKALLDARVGAIHLRVVRQLARLSEARVERLLWLPGAVTSLMPIRFEQVSTSVGEDDGAIVCAEWGCPYQALAFEVLQALAGVAAAIVEIALGHDAECAYGCEHPALRTVDLIHTVAFPHRPPLTATRQIDVPREDVAMLAIVGMIPIAGSATTAAAWVAEVVVIAVI